MPRALETQIAGESLFSDSIGVVAFISMSEIAIHSGSLSLARVGELFAVEAIGGVLLGLAIGWSAYRLLKSVDNYKVEVLPRTS